MGTGGPEAGGEPRRGSGAETRTSPAGSRAATPVKMEVLRVNPPPDSISSNAAADFLIQKMSKICYYKNTNAVQI